MAFWQIAPQNPQLQDVVASFCFSMDDGGPALASPIRVFPDAFADLLISVDDIAPSLGMRPARATLFGLKTRPLDVDVSKPVLNIAVRFRPGMMHKAFGVPAHELVDAAVELPEVCGNAASEFVRRAGAAPSFEQRLALTEWFLLRQLDAQRSRRPAQRAVAWAVDEITRSRGSLRIRTLAGRAGVSERHLERLFRTQVGLGAKMFARVVRFDAAKQAIDAGGAAAGVAHDCGYFDQSHMIRDFAQFAEATPARL